MAHQDEAMAQDELALTFRCPPELADMLPPPIPAVEGLPGWFKSLPQRSFNELAQEDTQTVKRCPPFIDAMTFGFLIPLVCDIAYKDGEFSWEFDPPHGGQNRFPRSPLSFHDTSQVAGSPFYEEDRFAIKFHNFWTIEAPPGYSVLFTHPVNRPDLPFTTITGLVDCDLYHDNWIAFPAQWRDEGFAGVLPKGTPIAQCIPVRREGWTARTGTLSSEDALRIQDVANAIRKEPDIYRHRFRATKR